MILSFAPSAGSGALALGLALLAMLSYALAAWPSAEGRQLPAWALGLGWLLHLLLLVQDIGAWGRGEAGARLGFGPVLSLTVWLVLGVHSIESRLVPLPTVRRVLATMGAAVVLLGWAFPGEVRPPLSAWAPLHWVLGVASYFRLGVELFPNVDVPVVVVTTTLKGASVDEMESSVTKPVEEAVNTVSGIDELRSTTKEGVSQIVVGFKLEKNGDIAAQELRDMYKSMGRPLMPNLKAAIPGPAIPSGRIKLTDAPGLGVQRR